MEGSREDWFGSTFQNMRSQGMSVSESLQNISNRLLETSTFLKSISPLFDSQSYPLKSSESAGDSSSAFPESPTTLTFLESKIHLLELSLYQRLRLMDPQREGSWFRKATLRQGGHINPTLIDAPIFPTYPETQDLVVKASLLNCWQSKDLSSLVFSDKQPSLWTLLLRLNKDLYGLFYLAPPYQHIHLLALPEGVPSELRNQQLDQILTEVKGAYLRSRDKLNRCFQGLWDGSCRFWSHRQQKQADQRARTNQDKTHTKGGYRPSSPQILREQALALLNMTQNHPLSEVGLKTHFRNLAKIHHPDFHPYRQQEAQAYFLKIHEAYQFLLREIKESKPV